MSLSSNSREASRLPEWLRVRLPRGPEYGATRAMLRDAGLHTVCQGARCPNIFECFSRHVATFMILGETCTRNCAFCNIGHDSRGKTLDAPDPAEPERLAEAARKLRLKHVVVTSVTRDDLPDGGGAHFAAVIRALRHVLPEASVEVLTPDFRGSREALETVLEAGPDVFNHNVETVPELYGRIRPQAVYDRSRELLRWARESGATTKSGFMVGLGETDDQLRLLLEDLALVCDVVTIGQYLPPTREHMPPRRYVEPRVFEEYARWGEALGLRMHSAPLVRSSYNAAEFVGRKGDNHSSE